MVFQLPPFGMLKSDVYLAATLALTAPARHEASQYGEHGSPPGTATQSESTEHE